jgi:hypothetical protein
MKIGLPRISKKIQPEEAAAEELAQHDRIQAAIDKAIAGFAVETPKPEAAVVFEMSNADCAETVAA